jgi:hypothetical protein
MLAWDAKVMSVVGRIDEMHILSAVRAAPMVGYLSPVITTIVDVFVGCSFRLILFDFLVQCLS